MPAQHPAASKFTVELRDFGKNEWVLFSRTAHPRIYDRLMNEARMEGVAPVELHHYIAPLESLQLISGNFGVAFAAKGMADQLRGADIVVRPLTAKALQIASYLVLPAERASRLVNVFGRAFLRKILPQGAPQGTPSQLPLDL